MTAISRPKAVELENVTKVFGQHTALTNVSFEIYDNEFFTLLGPSGCGKTTLLRMLAGFETPTAGNIRLRGRDIGELPPNQRRVNTVFQSYALFPHMTLEQNIAFGLENLGWEKARLRARVAKMLDMVHLNKYASRKPAQLSGGERQRVALARALAPEPEVLLLDEPLSALDLKLRQKMREELRSLQRLTGITFVFVTHDQDEALNMSDRICVLGAGEVQQIGTPGEIYENPENRFVSEFIGESNFFDCAVAAVDGLMATVQTPMGFPVTTLQKNAAEGGRATLSIRPEKIGIQDQAAGNIMTGVISSRSYLGSYTHYRVRAGDVDLLISERNAASGGQPYNVNDRVKIGFHSASARILGR